MPTFDLFIVGFLALFVIMGFALGFIRLFGGFVGLFVGVWLAGLYYGVLAGWLTIYLYIPAAWAQVLAFFLILSIVSKVISLIFKLLDRLFKILSIIPFTKTLNRLAGGFLGAIEGLLVLALLIFLLSRYSLSPQIDEMLKESQYAPLSDKFIFPLWPLLPEMIKKIKAII